MIDPYFLIEKYHAKLVTSQTLGEGIATTYDDTERIRNNIEYNHKELEQEYGRKAVKIISNLNDGWSFLHNTLLTEQLTTQYVQATHKILSKDTLGIGIISKAFEGSFRIEPVRIKGSKYRLPIRLPYQQEAALADTLNPTNYESTLDFGLSLFPLTAKQQFFVDCNKRTSFLTANKALLGYGHGLLLYPETPNQFKEFGQYLANYYEDAITLKAFTEFLANKYLITA